MNMENIDSNLTELIMEGSSENSTDVSSNSSTPIATEQQKLENDQDEEESNDPLNEFRAPTIGKFTRLSCYF